MTHVPWKDLRDAYGPATEVPEWLEAVATSRGRELLQPLTELMGRVLHQGTIYSASPPAVRAIIEFARSAEPAERHIFYELLTDFASSARKAIADGRAIPCHSGGDPVDGRAIRDAILAAHEQFARDLADPQPAIRACAADLVAAFPEAASAAAMLVRERFFVEPETSVRRQIIVGMIRVHDRYADWPDLLDAALRHETDEENDLLLLQALAAHSGPRSVSELISSWAKVHGTGDSYRGGETFFKTLHRLGPERELDAMLRALDQVTGRGVALTLARRLLSLVFKDRRTGWGQTASSKKGTRHKIDYWGLKGAPPALPAELNAKQSAVLRAVAAKTVLWKFDTNLWELFGLPQTAAKMARLADKN